MDLSLGKLQQLISVARAGSISRAAAELNLSQPALSRSIAAIEERYGFAIFNRFGHGVETTSAGAQVIAQAEGALQTLQVFERNMALLGSGKGGTLAMGMAPLLASQFLARFADYFFSSGSQVRLRAMIRPGQDLLDALKSDEIELFVYPETHVAPTDDIETEFLGYVSPACVVRRGHPLLERQALRRHDLAGFPWASSVEHPVGPALPPQGANLVCDNYHILREALLLTDLICICSTQFVSSELREGLLVALEVEDLPMPATAIYAAKLRGRINSPIALAALRELRAYLAQETPQGVPPSAP